MKSDSAILNLCSITACYLLAAHWKCVNKRGTTVDSLNILQLTDFHMRRDLQELKCSDSCSNNPMQIKMQNTSHWKAWEIWQNDAPLVVVGMGKTKSKENHFPASPEPETQSHSISDYYPRKWRKNTQTSLHNFNNVSHLVDQSWLV